jgi:hypothetical protein
MGGRGTCSARLWAGGRIRRAIATTSSCCVCDLIHLNAHSISFTGRIGVAAIGAVLQSLVEVKGDGCRTFDGVTGGAVLRFRLASLLRLLILY